MKNLLLAIVATFSLVQGVSAQNNVIAPNSTDLIQIISPLRNNGSLVYTTPALLGAGAANVIIARRASGDKLHQVPRAKIVDVILIGAGGGEPARRERLQTLAAAVAEVEPRLFEQGFWSRLSAHPFPLSRVLEVLLDRQQRLTRYWW